MVRASRAHPWAFFVEAPKQLCDPSLDVVVGGGRPGRRPTTHSTAPAENLSERSARDTEILIREVRPDAVLVQVGATLPDNMFQEHETVDEIGNRNVVPTSAYSVLLRSFLGRKSKDEYESIAGSLVLKEIFGVGCYGHLLVAKRMAEQFGSPFLMLDAPLVKPKGNDVESPPRGVFFNMNFQVALGLQPFGSAVRSMGDGVSSNFNRFCTSNPIHIHALKLLSTQLNLSLTSEASLGSDSDKSVGCIVPSSDYQPPSFAESVYPLLSDLYDIFSDVPSMGSALSSSHKMLDDIGRGQRVDKNVVSEVFIFQIVVEGLRIAMNNAGRLPLGKIKSTESGDVKFSELPVDEQSSCLLSEAIRSQTKNYKTVFAVVDAGRLGGIRKYWNVAAPAEIMKIVEDLVVDNYVDLESSLGGKRSAFTHSVIASAQKTSLSAMRTAFYEIMRKKRAQRVGYLPWATFGCIIATCAGLLAHGDGIECAVASLPSAPGIASLGRGIHNLQQAASAVSETSRTKIQKAMESLMYRLRNRKIQ